MLIQIENVCSDTIVGKRNLAVVIGMSSLSEIVVVVDRLFALRPHAQTALRHVHSCSKNTKFSQKLIKRNMIILQFLKESTRKMCLNFATLNGISKSNYEYSQFFFKIA